MLFKKLGNHLFLSTTACVEPTQPRGLYYKLQQLWVRTTPGCPSVRSHTAPQDAPDGKHQEGVDHWAPPPRHGSAGEAAAETQLHPRWGWTRWVRRPA